MPLAFDRLRRRVIPRSRTWRIVKGVTAAVAIVALLVSGYAAFLYIRGAERREVQRAAANMRYEQPLEVVTAAILTLRDLGGRSSSPDITHLVVARLKAIVLTPRTDTTDKGRAIRKHALETIKALRQNDLTKDFSGAELKQADLVDVDLSRAVLKGVSFEDGFLIRPVTSQLAILTGSDLSGAWVRNADFGAATLNGANVDGLDWFNADGFASDQLRSVDLSSRDALSQERRRQSNRGSVSQPPGEGYRLAVGTTWLGPFRTASSTGRGIPSPAGSANRSTPG